MAVDKKAAAAAAEAIRKTLTEQGLAQEEVNRKVKEFEDLQKRINEGAQSFLEFLLQQSEANKDNLILLQQAHVAQKKFADISEQIGGATLDTANYMRALTESQKVAVDHAQGYADSVERAGDTLREKLLMLGERNDSNEEDFRKLEEKIKLNDKDLAHLKETIANQKIHSKELENQTKAFEAIRESTEGWMKNLTGITKTGYEDSILGMVSGAGGLRNALTQVGESMSQTFTVANVLGNGVTGIMHETIRMVQATDSATAGFYKATGASGDYGAMITEVREESAIMGVNVDESAQAVTDLYTQMRGFTDLSKEAKKDIANFTAQMGELGISTGLTADLLDSATKSLNMTANEGVGMVKEVTAAAIALDIPVSQMNEDLKAALPSLAAYGSKGIQVFKGLAAQAKAAGMATGDLLGIAEQFDTFEGAAESVGRLNGILGGNYLNSLEMVNMTEEERIRTLVQTIEMTGRNWESLDKYERKAIAASIGIQDMDKANRLLGMSTAELDEKMSSADAGILSKEQMQEMADKARSFTEKLENLMQSMAVFLEPIISVINAVVEGFLWLNSILGNNLAPVVLALGAAYAFLTVQQRAGAVLSAKDAAQRLVLLQAKAAEATITKTLGVEKGVEALATIESTVAGTANTTTTGANTTARGANTTATFANAEATMFSTLKTMWSAAKTVITTGLEAARTVVIWGLVAAKWAFIAVAAVTTVVLGSTIAVLWNLAAATWGALGPWGLLALALLAVGVALFVALHSPPLWIGLGLLIGLMIGLAFAGMGAVAPMTAFGTAMLYVGVAVALAGVGFLMAGVGALSFGVAMIMVAAALVIASVALWIAVGAILALALGITIIGLFAWIAAPGLIFLAVAIVLLSSVLVAFALVSWLVLPPLFMLAIAVAIIGVSMALMFNAMSNGVGSIGAMASGLKEIAAAMSEMSTASVFKFVMLAEGFQNMVGIEGAAPALEATADVVRSTIDVDTTKVEAVEDLVDSLSMLAITAAISPGLLIAGALMGGIGDAFGGAPAGGEEKGQDIYLVMDPSGVKVIAKAVDVQLNKMHNVLASRS